MKILHSKSGFTLIEVVIAFSVLGFGILAMYSLQTISLRGNFDAYRITQETVTGADSLEQVLSHDFEKTIDETELPDLTAYLDPNYTVAWSITDDTPLEHVATIQVTITSKTDGKQVALQYLKVDPSSF